MHYKVLRQELAADLRELESIPDLPTPSNTQLQISGLEKDE